MNLNLLRKSFFATLLSVALAVFAFAPVQAETRYHHTTPPSEIFVTALKNGRADMIRGVYVAETFALPVVQQPVGNPVYVSYLNRTVTQFRMATEHGNIGLLAHNYLSGREFFNLIPGQEVMIVYGDGRVEWFIITTIYRYQALDPTNIRSHFVDLETGVTFSVAEVFTIVYGGSYHLTFQTCIENDGDFSWGRLFVIAMPLN